MAIPNDRSVLAALTADVLKRNAPKRLHPADVEIGIEKDYAKDEFVLKVEGFIDAPFLQAMPRAVLQAVEETINAPLLPLSSKIEAIATLFRHIENHRRTPTERAAQEAVTKFTERTTSKRARLLELDEPTSTP